MQCSTNSWSNSSDGVMEELSVVMQERGDSRNVDAKGGVGSDEGDVVDGQTNEGSSGCGRNVHSHSGLTDK